MTCRVVLVGAPEQTCDVGLEDAMTECELDTENEVLTACALCPNDDCGSLVFSPLIPDNAVLCDFVCPRCGTEFFLPSGQLVFQSVTLDHLREKLPIGTTRQPNAIAC